VRLESQLGQELDTEKAELRTERNLPTALGNDEKDRMRFVGTMTVFLVAPKTVRSVLQIPSLPPNLLKSKIPQNKMERSYFYSTIHQSGNIVSGK